MLRPVVASITGFFYAVIPVDRRNYLAVNQVDECLCEKIIQVFFVLFI